jgi:hypothetical protein
MLFDLVMLSLQIPTFKSFFFTNLVGMHRILFLPDNRPAGYPANPKTGYPANPKAGYRISGRILGFTTIFLVKYRYQIHFKKQL